MINFYCVLYIFLVKLLGYVFADESLSIQEVSPSIINDPPLKVGVCAIAKNENLYIREWVEYYKNLGVSKIFLFDNNDVDGERFEDVIGDYIENKFVKLIDKRGAVKVINTSYEYGDSIQGLAYSECYYNNYKNFDWLAFLDIDEFLSIDFKYKDLFDFLNDFKKYDGVKVQWRLYGDNGQVHYENKPVIERFKSDKNKKHNRYIKTILRCRDYDYTLLFKAHGVLNKEPYLVNVNKKRLYGTYDRRRYRNLPVYIDHYHTKSTEEYIKRKFMTTDAVYGYRNRYKSVENTKKHYFYINKFTREKQRMFDALKKNKRYLEYL